MLRLDLSDAAATRALGHQLGRCVAARAALAPRRGGVIWLLGDLGAGKTCLAQALATSLGVRGPVPSPTFVLVAEYPEARPPLCHVDLYRLSSPDEAENLGIADRVGGAELWVVEWPLRAPELWPDDRLELSLSRHGEGRRVEIVARGPESAALLAALERAQ